MTNNPTVTARYDLGLVINVINQHGVSLYVFGNDVAAIEPRVTGVFIYIRGLAEELWIGGGESPDQTRILTEEFVSAVASIRMNGVDKPYHPPNRWNQYVG